MLVGGTDLSTLSPKEQASLRRTQVGFVDGVLQLVDLPDDLTFDALAELHNGRGGVLEVRALSILPAWNGADDGGQGGVDQQLERPAVPPRPGQHRRLRVTRFQRLRSISAA